MPSLNPPDNPTPLRLLREAQYGFERDDTDGFEYAKRCLEMAATLLTTFVQGRDTRFELRDSGERFDIHRYAIFDKTGDATGERERPLAWASTRENGIFLVESLTNLYGEEH